MPDRCDRRWFCETFCGGSNEVLSLGKDDRIWPHVTDFSIYTPLALLAAIPRASDHFFRHDASVSVSVVRGVQHCVIGGLNERALVDELRGFFARCVPRALALCTACVCVSARWRERGKAQEGRADAVRS